MSMQRIIDGLWSILFGLGLMAVGGFLLLLNSGFFEFMAAKHPDIWWLRIFA